VKRPEKGAKGCELTQLLHLLGESHVLDILSVFLMEPRPRRFVELQDRLKMSPNTLADRLRNLVSAGFLIRTAYSEIPPRVEYEATAKALELGEVFESLEGWSKRNSLRQEILPVAAR